MRADLHLHSKYSDGILTIKEIITTLNLHGVRVFSLTDHDTIDGIEEGFNEAKNFSIDFIPGIEISCEYEEKEVHILGYHINHKNKDLLNHLEIFKENRHSRANKILDKLEEEGILIEKDDLEKYIQNGVLGRPHIADLLIEKGFVSSRKEAFTKYLSKGSSAYVAREKVNIETAVSLIENAGGVPVIAHPGLSFLNESLDKVINLGIKGIEVWHPDHNLMVTDYYYNYALSKNLIMTGGTDWHGDKCYKSFISINLLDENISRLKVSEKP